MQRPQSMLDEGFSEDLLSPPRDEDVTMLAEPNLGELEELKSALLSLPADKRLQLFKEICPTFSVGALFDLHGVIGGMVYFDPVRYLPDELILLILGYLSPKDLLTASLVSRPWRERTQDERLWHKCFCREGWAIDKSRMAEPEDLARERGGQIAERILRTTKPGDPLRRRGSRKRPRDEAFSDLELRQGSRDPYAAQDASGENQDLDEVMDGIQISDTSLSGSISLSQNDSAKIPLLHEGPETESEVPNLGIPAPGSNELIIQPPVFTAAQDPKISWLYMYKQRRRLERNWETGKHTMFRLPLPEYPDDGHKECVYTIQHSGRHLVSGSRDKTIRIWDLDTYRLKGTPLIGHEASVLCLQFDDRPGPDFDLIVSGGSDNSVIVWRFSTGEIIKHMNGVHSESVLNLRFDDRYLVTCSKDKSIKLFNRKEITRDSPLIPLRSLAMFSEMPNDEKFLSPFTLLDSFKGHQAAVNAVQVRDMTIISASGDRTIKAWDILTGNMTKAYNGHMKGIACVQFDGRRVVSGSSDKLVQIWDADTQAQVATLDGHTELVRTVQARFGDLDIMTDRELHDEARRADRAFLDAYPNGPPGASGTRENRRPNAGSTRPEDMTSYGTKVPPGGGGTRWARIVSGSYDETLIVWKRDRKGNWRVNLRLNQATFLGTNSRASVPNAAPPPQQADANNPSAPAADLMSITTAHQTRNLAARARDQLERASNLLQSRHATGVSANEVHAMANQVTQRPVTTSALSSGASNSTPINPQPQPAADVSLASSSQTTTPQQRHELRTQQILEHHQHTQQLLQQLQQSHGAQHQQWQQQGSQQGEQRQAPAPQPHITQAPQGAAPGLPHHHYHHHQHQHQHARPPAAGGAAAHRSESNRVLKLQFDTRRIIACSQNKVIVGWDFAAGDKDLEWVGDWCAETL